MFKNNAPTTPQQWIDQGHDITPCREKKAYTKDWPKKNLTAKDFKPNDNIGLKLKDIADFDIDNPIAQKFIKKYLKSCGAIYGRKHNPESHYLFKESSKFKEFNIPKTLEHLCKDFSHGAHLGEIRSGENRYSIAPNSIIEGDKVEWNKYAKINSYNGDLKLDIGKIMLSTALAILYPAKGTRDIYTTAIAGALANNTDWTGSYIDTFVLNIAENAYTPDENYMQKNGKGTNAKNAIKTKKKTLGMPTLAEKLNCSVPDIAEMFSWIGITNEGGLFSALKCYNTIPKYWELKYKDKWIRIMSTKELMSYASVSILVEENCFETAPFISPKEWRAIRQDLYQNVQHIDVPFEQSFFGVIAEYFVNFCSDRYTVQNKDGLFELAAHQVWNDSDEQRVVFRLEGFTGVLRNARLSFEQRQLTAMLVEYFKAKPVKIHYKSKELRCWEVPMHTIEKFRAGDKAFASKLLHDRMEKKRNEPHPY